MTVGGHVAAFLLFALAWSAQTTAGTEAAGKVSFARDVAPVLHRCVGCHGTSVQSSGLRLDHREEAMRGGYSGKVILPGKSSESRLIRVLAGQVKGVTMPPDGAPLPPAEIEILKRWIDEGADWPESTSQTAAASPKSAHWAFQPIRRPAVADTREAWMRNPIDAFLLAQFRRRSVQPSSEASKEKLARRLFLDITGLPPSPAEMERFLADSQADAYEHLVDRLLASPHYGEKWGRFWLDLARYAESDGYSADFIRPWAWRYRDWVIEAFNKDIPFDQFTVEQLAGDLLPAGTIEQRIATGFLRNNLTNVEAGVDLNQTRFEQIVDRTNAVATVWLGLTAGCAQCHDHKFDPFSQKEYYQLFAFFDRTEDRDIDAPLPGELGSYLRYADEYERKRQALFTQYEVEKWQRWWEGKMLASAAQPGVNADWDFVWTQWGSKDINYTVIRLSPERRSPEQRRFITESFIDMMSFPASKAEYDALGFKELSAKLKQLKTEFPPLSKAQTVVESVEPRTTYLRVRGNYQENGVPVEPDTPAVLPPLPSAKPANRLTLARWLVSPENPLPARAFASRVWQELFGRGLVASSENFGVTGDRPAYPELLDWLASAFRDNWSMKGLIRLMVTSAAYRQSSEARPELEAVDPQNTLFARQTRLRLNAELIRDQALVAGGLFYSAIGGPSIYPPLPLGALDAALNARDPKQLWPESKGRDSYRRGVYIHHQRRLLHPQLAIFDQPGAAQSCTGRERSNTPLQALNLLNDPTLLECARGFATRVVRQPAATFQERLNYAFRIALSRLPTEPESARLREYFQQRVEMLRQDPKMTDLLYPSRALGADPIDSAAWVGLGRVLMNLDEFITRE